MARKSVRSRHARAKPFFHVIEFWLENRLMILRLGCNATEELALDMDRQISDPAGDPYEVLVSAHRPVDQHDGRRPCPVLVSKPPSQIEQHDSKIRVDGALRAHPVNQKPGVFETC